MLLFCVFFGGEGIPNPAFARLSHQEPCSHHRALSVWPVTRTPLLKMELFFGFVLFCLLGTTTTTGCLCLPDTAFSSQGALRDSKRAPDARRRQTSPLSFQGFSPHSPGPWRQSVTVTQSGFCPLVFGCNRSPPTTHPTACTCLSPPGRRRGVQGVGSHAGSPVHGGIRKRDDRRHRPQKSRTPSPSCSPRPRGVSERKEGGRDGRERGCPLSFMWPPWIWRVPSP